MPDRLTPDEAMGGDLRTWPSKTNDRAFLVRRRDALVDELHAVDAALREMDLASETVAERLFRQLRTARWRDFPIGGDDA